MNSIGIDFGTSKTLVTWMNRDSDRPEAIRLGRGRDELPTTVYVCEDDTLLYGEDADDNAAFDFSRYCRGFKMHLGSSAPLVVGSSRVYAARDLSTAFLRHVKERCETE